MYMVCTPFLLHLIQMGHTDIRYLFCTKVFLYFVFLDLGIYKLNIPYLIVKQYLKFYEKYLIWSSTLVKSGISTTLEGLHTALHSAAVDFPQSLDPQSHLLQK